MAVTVLIKRKAMTGKGELLEHLYEELVALAVQQKGYLGAESMRRLDVPDEHLVISKWAHIDDWTRWLISETRMAFQERIDALIDSKTRFEIYE